MTAPSPPATPPLYTIPMDKRPPGYGPWRSKIVFPLVFDLGMLGINSAQFLFLPLLLIPVVGQQLFRRAIAWTKDGFGRLLIAITVLCAPTSLVFTTDGQPELEHLVERDARGNMTRINLPDRLVLIANHQAYTDWMYLWIIACYSGVGDGITILLKASLQNIPIVGWGMRFFRFIFLHRSWAADKDNLTCSLQRLAHDATGDGPDTNLTTAAAASTSRRQRSPLWLLIFPEGTITSDNERAKSQAYAAREGVPDLVGVLHPRATGLLFCLRTLLPAIPDLQLLDITISYPGVPYGAYPQEWYGLGSVFWRSVPPPVVHVHLKLYSKLGQEGSEIPGLTQTVSATREDVKANTVDAPTEKQTSGTASPPSAKDFELWLRGVWADKDKRLQRLAEQGVAISKGAEVVPVRQLSWADWVAAFGGGGAGLAVVVYLALRHYV